MISRIHVHPVKIQHVNRFKTPEHWFAVSIMYMEPEFVLNGEKSSRINALSRRLDTEKIFIKTTLKTLKVKKH